VGLVFTFYVLVHKSYKILTKSLNMIDEVGELSIPKKSPSILKKCQNRNFL